MTRQRRRRTRTRRDSGLERPAGNRADLLHTTLLATVEDTRVTGLPHLALLHGETGRGKSYVVQALYDELCRRQPGYWLPGLKPSWPPPSLATLREQRKRIAPPDELRQPGAAASFLWIAVSCSGYWDAPRLDPTADLLRQLQRALAETVDATLAAARRRRDWVVDRVVEGIGQLEPIVGAAKFAIDTLVQAPEALRHGEPTPLAAERQRTFEALTRYARLLDALELEPPTLVVTVDDAGAAPVDLLGALAACVAEPADTESDLSEETRLLPRVLDQMPPLPVLFVLTAWDHMLPPKDDAQPLAQWLAEYEQLGLERETLRCREIQPTEAKGLLDRWTLGPDEAMRDQIVSHIASNSAHSLVNPLVLAEHVAWVEERRDPFSGEVAVTSDEIDALSTSPDHHVEERLERLRRSDDGPAVHSVLATLCSLGITLPWGLVEELLAASGAGLTVDRLQERLVRLSAVLTQQPPDPLRLFVLDADLYDHLHRRHQLTSVQQDACATACAAFLRRWIEELEPDSMLRGVSDHWSLTRMQRMAPIAVRALERIDDADTVAVLVRTLAGGEPPALGDVPGPRSAVVVVWLASDRPDEVSTSDLLAGCQELGASRIALSCLLALARERGAMLGEPELEQIVDRLAPHVEIADVQTVLVSLLCDRGHALRAQRLLEGVPLAPQSVLQLAQALELGGSPSAALALLSAHSDGNGTLIRRHATLLERIGQPDAALALLEARPETWQLSRLRAEILGRIGRDDDRGALLEQWTDRNADAARLLAADRAAAGRIDAARQLLEPWRRSWMPAAVQAARLEWADGRYIAALQALAPFLDRGGPAEATLAQMLDEIGREGMRFQLGPGGRVESVVRTQVGGAAKPRSRRERPRPAAEIRAEVVRELETASPRDVAGRLLVTDAATQPGRRHVTEALRAHFTETRDRGVAAVVHHLLASTPATEEAVACTTADFAFIARFDNAAERAGVALRPFAESEAPAIRGRLAALAALDGVPYDELSRLERLRTSDRAFAVIGAQRMVSGDPDAEMRMWRALTDAVQATAAARMRRLVWVFAAGRVLAIQRALGAHAPDDAGMLQQIFPSARAREPIRTLEGTLYAYAANPAEVAPPLYPYQAISLHAALVAAGRPNDDLGEQLVQRIAAQLAAAPEQQTAFAAWAPLSPLARRVLAAADWAVDEAG